MQSQQVTLHDLGLAFRQAMLGTTTDHTENVRYGEAFESVVSRLIVMEHDESGAVTRWAWK